MEQLDSEVAFQQALRRSSLVRLVSPPPPLREPTMKDTSSDEDDDDDSNFLVKEDVETYVMQADLCICLSSEVYCEKMKGIVLFKMEVQST